MHQNLTNTVNAFDAKTHFSQLLKRAESGEEITILRHNHPVAILISAIKRQKFNIRKIQEVAVQKVMDDLAIFRKGKTLGGLSIKDLISEGRR